MTAILLSSIIHPTTYMYIIAGAGVIAGMRAAKFLLSGTKEVPSFRMYSRTFQKPGDYNQAVKDFDSVNPTHVQDFILPNVVCCCCIVAVRPRYTSKVKSGRSVSLTTLFLGRLTPP